MEEETWWDGSNNGCSERKISGAGGYRTVIIKEDNEETIKKLKKLEKEVKNLRKQRKALRLALERFKNMQKEYRVLKKLADRMKADSKRLFNVNVLKRALK